MQEKVFGGKCKENTFLKINEEEELVHFHFCAVARCCQSSGQFSTFYVKSAVVSSKHGKKKTNISIFLRAPGLRRRRATTVAVLQPSRGSKKTSVDTFWTMCNSFTHVGITFSLVHTFAARRGQSNWVIYTSTLVNYRHGVGGAGRVESNMRSFLWH